MTRKLVPTNGTEIATLAEARALIQRALLDEDTDTLRAVRDEVEVWRHHLARREESRQAANDAGEIKVRSGAALGLLDAERAPHGGDKQVSGGRNLPAPLSELHPGTRAALRKLGKLHKQGRLDGLIAAARNDDLGVVTEALVIRQMKSMGGTTFECYTPAKYVEAAREVLEEIDLDPASDQLTRPADESESRSHPVLAQTRRKHADHGSIGERQERARSDLKGRLHA